MSNGSLNSTLETVWQHLRRGVVDRRHPARHPILATTGPDGADLRTLVLRRTDSEASVLEFHTDRDSPKCDHISSDPRVAIHVWLPSPKLQIRAKAIATLEPGDQQVFASLPVEARANYGGPIPGSPVDAPMPASDGDPSRFTRILCQIETLDILALGDPQMRALFRREDGWKGQWVAP